MTTREIEQLLIKAIEALELFDHVASLTDADYTEDDPCPAALVTQTQEKATTVKSRLITEDTYAVFVIWPKGRAVPDITIHDYCDDVIAAIHGNNLDSDDLDPFQFAEKTLLNHEGPRISYRLSFTTTHKRQIS